MLTVSATGLFQNNESHIYTVNGVQNISLIVIIYSTSILVFDSLQDRIEYRIENTE